MLLWQAWCLAGIIMIIVEAFTPALFFLNLAFACFIAGFIAFFNGSPTRQVVAFVLCSIIFIAFLRPIFIKNKRQKDGTEFSEKYVGQIAEVIEPVTKTSGRISIYGESWKAMSYSDETFNVGDRVRILDNISIVMMVEKIQK